MMMPLETARGDRLIAGLLRWGTGLACSLIAVGMLLVGQMGAHAIRAGVAMLILLPVARVGVMMAAFVLERDRIHAAIAAAVLLIIATSVAIAL